MTTDHTPRAALLRAKSALESGFARRNRLGLAQEAAVDTALAEIAAATAALAPAPPANLTAEGAVAVLNERGYEGGGWECREWVVVSENARFRLPADAAIASARALLAGREAASDGFEALFRDYCAWADATFPTDTPKSIATHLGREVRELAADPSDPREIADCFLLAAYLAHKQGISLLAAARAKFAEIQTRQWGEPDAEGVVEHIRSAPRCCCGADSAPGGPRCRRCGVELCGECAPRAEPAP